MIVCYFNCKLFLTKLSYSEWYNLIDTIARYRVAHTGGIYTIHHTFRTIIYNKYTWNEHQTGCNREFYHICVKQIIQKYNQYRTDSRFLPIGNWMGKTRCAIFLGILEIDRWIPSNQKNIESKTAQIVLRGAVHGDVFSLRWDMITVNDRKMCSILIEAETLIYSTCAWDAINGNPYCSIPWYGMHAMAVWCGKMMETFAICDDGNSMHIYVLSRVNWLVAGWWWWCRR